jgi:hypothetical protein
LHGKEFGSRWDLSFDFDIRLAGRASCSLFRIGGELIDALFTSGVTGDKLAADAALRDTVSGLLAGTADLTGEELAFDFELTGDGNASIDSFSLELRSTAAAVVFDLEEWDATDNTGDDGKSTFVSLRRGAIAFADESVDVDKPGFTVPGFGCTVAATELLFDDDAATDLAVSTVNEVALGDDTTEAGGFVDVVGNFELADFVPPDDPVDALAVADGPSISFAPRPSTHFCFDECFACFDADPPAAGDSSCRFLLPDHRSTGST